MVIFAFLGNTLFLTILVSMLSNTFSLIAANATAEINFRRAVLTFEGVKSDAIFAYMPPFNILALIIVLPMKFFVSDRMFHKINVVATRTLNAPLLLMISLYERQTLWQNDRHRHRPPKSVDWKSSEGPAGRFGKSMSFWDISRFSVHGDIQAVFETEPPESVLDAIAEEDDLQGPNATGKALHAALEDQFPSMGSPVHRSPKQSPATSKSRRGKSTPKKTPPRRRSSGSDRLAATFGSPSDGSDKERKRNKSGTKKRPTRMDSIVDYTGDGSAMDEANVRLHKLEESVGRIEEILMRFVDQDTEYGEGRGDDHGGDDGDSDVDAALNQEIQTGIHE